MGIRKKHGFFGLAQLLSVIKRGAPSGVANSFEGVPT